MAVKKKKMASIKMTLWDVPVSFPELADPKPFKGNKYYGGDFLLSKDHPQLGDLRKSIKKVRIKQWGEDKTEWPEGASKKFLEDGDTRSDRPEYKGYFFFKAASKNRPVPVVDLKGNLFEPQQVRGGMFVNAAIIISAWDNEGDEGISIWLQGVQVNTKKTSLNFGGTASVEEMFGKKKKKASDDDEDAEDQDDEDEDDSDDDEEEEAPKSKKKKKPPVDDDDEDEDEDEEEDDEEDDEPRKSKSKKKKKPPVDDDDEDEDDSDDDEEDDDE